MAEIRLEHIYKSYGKHDVHADLNMTIAGGECFTLLGPSGCGKTVLMRMIAGFEMPDKGKIYIDGKLVSDGEARTSVPPNLRGLGVVFQDYAVWPHMTVFDNIAYPLKIAGETPERIKEQVTRTVALVNLGGLESRLPSQLSGGQQQRVALGRALAAGPSLMLLDEPLNNLDANLREEMRFEIKELQKKLGITILYVTHDQEIALAISDRIAIMDHAGKVMQAGAPAEVFERPANDFVFRFLGVSNFLPVEQKSGGLFVGGQELRAPDAPAIQAEKLVAAFRPSDLTISRGGDGLKGKIVRASFLGADMDYLIAVESRIIRSQLNTYTALQNDLILREGDECVVRFIAVTWFDAAKIRAEGVS
ncbi:MAG: ABC transporter ATP-binding protein [Spirochaetaceae bacterium]|jgi:iron(III) transport system ATP-binding protein|nr:ABC transporter ATP-binding protein [Spirochaetaceae bacterium]